jgi:hypothetical protein
MLIHQNKTKHENLFKNKILILNMKVLTHF